MTDRAAMGFAALVLCALLTGCATSQTAQRPIVSTVSEWNFGSAPGRRITTDHYEILTTVDDAGLLASFPELMERTFDYYQELVPPARINQDRMTIYLFADRAEWVAFTKRFAGVRAPIFLKIRNGGYSERGVTAIQFVANQVTFPLMAHEGLHQYLYHFVNQEVPAWLNEGLAVACEGQRWTTSGLAAFEPTFNPSRKNALVEAILRDRLMPLRDLLETNAGRIVGETSRTVATYYAQVWALVVFMMEGQDGKYADGFRNMCDALGSADFADALRRQMNQAGSGGAPNRGEAMFRAYISDDLDTFEAEMNAYLRKTLLRVDT
ncbi:MAG: hypothetical protein AB7N71_12415 [Phycisphaerae bacterium]